MPSPGPVEPYPDVIARHDPLPEEPPAEPAEAGEFGLILDPEVVAAAAAASEREHEGPPLVGALLGLIDDTASRLLDHPIRPRIKVSPGGMLKGEIDLLQVEVPAVLAAGLVLDRLVVRAEHVRIAPGLPPHLHAGPVSMRAYVCQENVDRWVKTSRLPIKLKLSEDGVLLTTGVRGFKMSETLADIEVVGPFLRLAPRRMKIVGLPTTLVRFFKGYLPLPPLPRGARLRDVRHGDGELAVTFVIDHVDEALTPDIARRLGAFTRLPIPGLG